MYARLLTHKQNNTNTESTNLSYIQVSNSGERTHIVDHTNATDDGGDAAYTADSEHSVLGQLLIARLLSGGNALGHRSMRYRGVRRPDL